MVKTQILAFQQSNIEKQLHTRLLAFVGLHPWLVKIS